MVHIAGAMCAFGFGVAYLWMNTFISFYAVDKLNTRRVAVYRLFLTTISTIACGMSACQVFLLFL